MSKSIQMREKAVAWWVPVGLIIGLWILVWLLNQH